MLVIIASPYPVIDVFTILKEAPFKLLSGLNPYDTVYSSVYSGVKTDYYPYWPASFLLQIPLVFTTQDPRVLMLLSDIGSMLLLYIIGGRSLTAEILALIYIFRPNSIFIIEQSWITPMTFFLSLSAFYFYLRKKYSFLAGSLGILTSIQPYFFIFVPFYLFLGRAWKRIIPIYFAVVTILVTPFFILNMGRFLDKTILVYFKPLDQIPTIPVHRSLNLNTAVYIFTGYDIPSSWTMIILGLIGFFIYWKIYHAYRNNTFPKKVFPGFMLLGMNIVIFTFYLLFRQSFINYYYFAGGFIILWLTLVYNQNKI